MSDVRRRYAIRFELENGELVEAKMESIGASGEKTFQKLEKGARGVDQRLSALGQTILGRLVPSLTVAGLAGAAQKAVRDMTALKDEAGKLGIEVEKLQKYRLMGADAGVKDASMDAMIGGFIQRVSEAQQGMGKLLPILDHYNIKLKDAVGQNRSWEEILRDISVAISQAGDKQEQMYIASKAGLEDFLDVLSKGPAELDRLGEAAVNSGNIIQEHLVDRAAEFDKAWKNVSTRWSNSFKSDVIRVLSSVTDLLNAMFRLKGTLDTLPQIEYRIAEVKASMGKGPFSGVNDFFLRGELERLEKERERLQNEKSVDAGSINTEQQERLRTLLADYYTKTSGIGAKGGQTVAESQAAAEAAKKAQEESIRLAAREQEKIQSVIEALQFKSEQMGRDALQQEIHNQLRAAGVDLYSREGQQIARLVEEHYALEQAQERNQQAAKLLGDAIRGTASAFTDLRTYALNTLADIAEALVNLSTGGSAGNSIGGALATGLYSIFSSGDLGSGYNPAVSAPPRKPGFAYGGSFQVGGNGGTDTTPVSFWATRGERVTVETPAQQRNAGAPVNITIVNNSRAQIETRRTGQNGRDLEVVVAESVGKAITAGKLDGAMGSRYGLRPGTTA